MTDEWQPTTITTEFDAIANGASVLIVLTTSMTAPLER